MTSKISRDTDSDILQRDRINGSIAETMKMGWMKAEI
jgi:hypothetical protein